MSLQRTGSPLVLAVLAVITSWGRAAAADSAQAQFQRGYFLQSHEHDAQGAIAAYEQVVADAAAPAALKAEARTRIQQCREDLATADLARLMPADTLGYFELNRPGKHLVHIARMLGLAPGDGAASAKGAPTTAEKSKSAVPSIPLDGPFVLPGDFKISPALFAELEKVRGAAVAVTSVSRDGQPHGVAVIDAGESNLLRGLLETGVQLVTATESIGGHPTYTVDNMAWVVTTSRLFIIASSKDEASRVIKRLDGGDGGLASQKTFQRVAADRKDALAFVYVSGQRLLPTLMLHVPLQEVIVARAALDLGKLESLSAVVRTGEAKIEIEAKVSMAEGQQNLAYALVRTAPTSRRSLSSVPSGVAAVALIGLNPATTDAPGAAAAEGPRSITAMDLGRELFANVEELSAFVMPSAGGNASQPGLPDVGLVFAVKDARQSEALWTQLLSIPAMVGLPYTKAPVDVTIEGVTGKQFEFPFVPPVVVVPQAADRKFIVGTQGAVTAALATAKSRDPITRDPAFQPVLSGLSPNTSKAILVHAGRATDLYAAATIRPRDAQEFKAASSQIAGNLVLAAVTDESPTQLAVRVQATGLPNLGKLLYTLASSYDGPVAATETGPAIRSRAVPRRASEPKRAFNDAPPEAESDEPVPLRKAGPRKAAEKSKFEKQ